MRFMLLIFLVCLSNRLVAQQVADSIVKRSKPDTPLVLFKTSPVTLKEVTIKGTRNYLLDSLNRRKEFASVYANKAPHFKDIFIAKSSYAPSSYSPFQSSTSSLVSINLLSVAGLITKNRSPVSKLQKRLLKDEAYNYVNHAFSIAKVQALTSLKGDSLQNFMSKYRPSIEEIKQMTDYQLMLYIKKSYNEYTR